MASFLVQSAPGATSNVSVLTNSGSSYYVGNVSITNRGSGSTTVRLALTAGASPTTAEYIEYEATIPGYSVLERTGVVVPPGKRLVVYAGNANLSVSYYGLTSTT